MIETMHLFNCLIAIFILAILYWQTYIWKFVSTNRIKHFTTFYLTIATFYLKIVRFCNFAIVRLAIASYKVLGKVLGEKKTDFFSSQLRVYISQF